MKARVAILGLLTALFVALITLSTLTPAPAQALGAHIINVTTTQDELADDGYCSLRQAIRSVNLQTASGIVSGECPAGSGEDTVLVPAGIYTLTIPGMTETASLTGDLNITRSVALVGASSATTIIDANQLDRVLDVAQNITVTLSGLTLQNGYLWSDLGGPYYYGGGIQNAGTLIVTDTVVQNNWATSVGGIANAATLTMTHSVVQGNFGDTLAGGIGCCYSYLYPTNVILYLKDVTVSDNHTSSVGWGSGLFLGDCYATKAVVINSVFARNYHESAAIYIRDGSLSLVNTSVMSNTAEGIHVAWGTLAIDQSAIIYNGLDGVHQDQGIVSINNSTVSQNGGDGVYGYPSGFRESMDLNNVTLAANGNHGIETGNSFYFNFFLQNTLVAGNAASDCSGNFTLRGYNLIQNATGCVLTGTQTGDRFGVDPMLGPLQDNGGPTWTQALLPSSPAIDAGNPAGCRDNQGQLFLTDQRGFVRVFDGDSDGKAICDIGALEYGSFPFPDLVRWLYLPLVQH